jgi:hypothetical protein
MKYDIVSGIGGGQVFISDGAWGTFLQTEGVAAW